MKKDDLYIFLFSSDHISTAYVPLTSSVLSVLLHYSFVLISLPLVIYEEGWMWKKKAFVQK